MCRIMCGRSGGGWMYKGLALLLLPPSLSGPLSSLPFSPSSSLALSPSLLSGLPSSLTRRLSCRLSYISYGVAAFLMRASPGAQRDADFASGLESTRRKDHAGLEPKLPQILYTI